VCPLGVSITIRLACILLILVACAVPLHAEGCGVASLFDFCELVGERPNRDQREQIVEAYPSDEASMLDIKQAAEGLGIELVGVKAAFGELVSQIPGLKRTSPSLSRWR